MLCPNCGKEIEEGSVFCRFCGMKIEQPAEALSSEAQANEVQPAPAPVFSEAQPVPTSIYPQVQASAAEEAKKPSNAGKVLSLIGMILSIIGCAGFLTIVLVGLIVYNRVYLYDGYEFTKILCTVCIILMVAGALLLFLGLLMDKGKRKVGVVFSILLIVLSLAGSGFLISKAVGSKKKSSSSSKPSSSSSSYSSSSYEMDHKTYCILYMKVSNVKIRRSGDWVYCTGTIKNTGKYSIKFVKVRAGFKDSRGNVIDSDWTYAVDSSWLYPNESKNFEMMVKDPNRKIQTADVIVVYD